MIELQEVLNELKDILKATDMIVDSGMILDCATRIYISQQISKDRQQPKSFTPANQFQPKPVNTQGLASEKQVWALMNKCGVPESVAKTMTSTQAFQAISKSMGNK